MRTREKITQNRKKTQENLQEKSDKAKGCVAARRK